MWAELRFRHAAMTEAEVRAALVAVLGADDPAAASSSGLAQAGGAQVLNTAVTYSHLTNVYRVLASWAWEEELQVIVEPARDDIRLASESALDAVERALATKNGRLFGDVNIRPLTSDVTVMQGRRGYLTHVETREATVAFLTAAASLGFWLLGINSFAREDGPALMLGALPSLAGAAIALAWAYRRRKALLWRMS